VIASVYHLTRDELLDMLDLFDDIQVLEEGPRDLIPAGSTLLWPSFCADYVADDGRHVEAIVQTGEELNVILVSKDLWEAIK